MKIRILPVKQIRTPAGAMLALAACIFSTQLRAQQPQQNKQSHIGFAYPAGAAQGASCEVTVGGQFLDGSKAVYLSGTDVTATVIKINKPIPQKRLNELRDYLEEARKKLVEAKADPVAMRKFQREDNVAQTLKVAGATDDEIKMYFQMRRDRNDPKRQQNVQLSESVTIQINIAPGAPPGPRELRILTPLGLTNPLNFCVGSLPEQVGNGQAGNTVDTAARVTLPVVLDGHILPGGVDHYSFQARKGAQIVVATQGRDLMPYLADAVPGWFQPVVAVYDTQGAEVAYADHFRFSPDPVLCFTAPHDGPYLLEIRDALYRGREDFIYRITVGEIPYVTNIFPLGGKPGEFTKVTLAGWNLGKTDTTLAPLKTEGIHPIPFLNNDLALADRVFAIDSLPQAREVKPNNDVKHAQAVTLPVIIDGQVTTPGEVGFFSFQCAAGDQIVAETYARRLYSQLDSWLKITDSNGHQLAFNDDMEDKAAALLPHCADSYLNFKAPGAGTYYLQVGDTQGKGGPEYGYRLRISHPIPDYALRIVPSSINGRSGLTVPITVYALRKDGYLGPVDFALKDAPKGFLLSGGRIPSGKDEIRATVTFPQTTPEGISTLAIEGSAIIGGLTITHDALPADDMMQAFAYHHLVTANKLLMVVTGTNMGRSPVTVSSPQPMKIATSGPAHGEATLIGTMPFNITSVHLQLNNAPDGISVETITSSQNGAVISFKADPSKVKPDSGGNLLVEAYNEFTVTPPGGKPPEKRYSYIGLLPAIPYEIVKP